jgi:hypothetical protein
VSPPEAGKPVNTYPKKNRECFGHLETVFPMGEDGLRHTPDICLECPDKTECLRAAIQGVEGLKVREEHLSRAYDSGTIGFFERWARKKELQQKKGKPKGLSRFFRFCK